MFALLRRYVENERGGIDSIRRFSEELRSRPDPNAPEGIQEEQAGILAEAAELYQWWTGTWPSLKERRKELMNVLYDESRISLETAESGSSRAVLQPFDGHEQELFDELEALEERVAREEQEMLHRLVDIRPSL